MYSEQISITQIDIQPEKFSDVTMFRKTRVVYQNPQSYKLAKEKQRNLI